MVAGSPIGACYVNEYMKEHDIRTESVYLSLGDREEKTRNPVMATGFAWVMKNNSVCI